MVEKVRTQRVEDILIKFRKMQEGYGVLDQFVGRLLDDENDTGEKEYQWICDYLDIVYPQLAMDLWAEYKLDDWKKFKVMDLEKGESVVDVDHFFQNLTLQSDGNWRIDNISYEKMKRDVRSSIKLLHVRIEHWKRCAHHNGL